MWFRSKRQFSWQQSYDMHSHILPGIDDGVQQCRESVKIVECLLQAGIKRFVFTPHVAHPENMNDRESIAAAYNILCTALEESPVIRAGLRPESMAYAAEYRMDRYFLDLIASRSLLSFADPSLPPADELPDCRSRLVLVENNFAGEAACLHEALFLMQEAQYRPVLVHPERFPYYWGRMIDVIKEYKQRGCLIQCNALSFTGFYGRGPKVSAWRMKEAGLIDFISGDLHSLAQTRTLLEYRK